MQNAVSSNLKFQDLNGNGIERARSYLIKVGGFSLSDGEKEWGAITDIFMVRNCFMHTNGIAAKTNQALSTYVEKTTTLTLHQGKISMMEGFLAEVVTAMRCYCEILAKATIARFPSNTVEQ